MMVRVVLVLGLVILIAAGCGVYTFSPAGKATYKTITVERFGNETAEYELADHITDVIIDALIADGTMKVVAQGNGEVILRGSLVQYDRKPFKYDASDHVESYKVTMDFQVSLINPADNSEIWKERMSQYGVYDVATETEADAQQAAVDRLVEQIILRTTKSW